MSALGRKQTFRAQDAMSAYPESGIAMQSGPLPAWWPELPAGDFHQQGRGFLCAAPHTSEGKMSYTVPILLLRNLHNVFGVIDPEIHRPGRQDCRRLSCL